MINYSEVEKKREGAFEKKHTHNGSVRFVGHHETAQIINGTIVILECKICGVKEDITDYECW